MNTITITCAAHLLIVWQASGISPGIPFVSDDNLYDPLCDVPDCAAALARFSAGGNYLFYECSNDEIISAVEAQGGEAYGPNPVRGDDGQLLLSYPCQDSPVVAESKACEYFWRIHHDAVRQTLMLVYAGALDESPSIFLHALHIENA